MAPEIDGSDKTKEDERGKNDQVGSRVRRLTLPPVGAETIWVRVPKTGNVVSYAGGVKLV